MSVVQYFLKFGNGSPATYTGLSPTFTVFRTSVGNTTPPSITEMSTTGLYTFSYNVGSTQPIAFVVDGATTGLINSDRYIVGSLSLNDQNYQNIGPVGLPTDGIGDNSTVPTTMFGFIKRIQNWLEGQSTYTKATGVWQAYDRTGATLISQRTITENTSTVTKT